jgi:YD repeat-containing protein
MWRQQRSYKPYKVNLGVNKHKYDVNFHNNAIADYGFDIPYTLSEYYTDGTGRIKNLKPEGQPWQSHFISFGYGTNTSGEVTGYSNSALYKSRTIDENGKKKLDFRDKLGNLVQFVTDSAGLKLTTKFENDVLGNMTKSTPPKGSGYETNYTYNTLSQLTEKTSPDAGTVKYLYDRAGNLRFTQDANQASGDKFTYNKYDALNRLIEVGEYTSGASFTQANANSINFPTESNPNKILQKKFYYDTGYIAEQSNLKGNLSKSDAYRQEEIVLTTFFSYDENNRVEWIVHQIPGTSDKK